VPKYEHVHEIGYRFVFKRDEADPELLHIYARHLATIDDALDVFFSTDASWNEEFHRWENRSDTHGLYWFWIDRRCKIVMIVSCFGL
jgi:hypothetical protein